MSENNELKRKPAATRRRSVTFGGISTSIFIEDAFWHEIRRMAKDQKLSVNKLISDVNQLCGGSELSSAVRVFVLQHARQRPPVVAANDAIFLPP